MKHYVKVDSETVGCFESKQVAYNMAIELFKVHNLKHVTLDWVPIEKYL